MSTKKTTGGAKGKATTGGAKGKGKGKAAAPPPAEWRAPVHVNGAVFSVEKPGLLAWLYQQLYFAAPERGGQGMTKAELLAGALKKAEFVARYNGDETLAAAKMKVTISAQVPSQFKSERGFAVGRVERADGTQAYYLDSEASEEYLCRLCDELAAGKCTVANADNIVKRPLPWPPTTKQGKAKLKWRGADEVKADAK